MDKKKILEKIRALMAKTTTAGCSESEALVATQKAMELLEKYNLDMDEVEFNETECDELPVIVGKGKKHPVVFLASTIAQLTDTKVVYQRQTFPNKLKILIYFGFPKDIEIASYITELLMSAMNKEYKEFKKSDYFKMSKLHASSKKQSFMTGMTIRLQEKMTNMIIEKQRARETTASTGTSLIIVKNQVVDEEFAELVKDAGIGKRTVRPAAGRSTSALEQGYVAGNNIDINPGVENKSSV